MSFNFGIRYVVIAAGSPDDKASDEDIENIQKIVSEMCPFKATVLSEHVSDRLTVELLRERGAFPV
jgi:hypothetical protein